MALKDQIPVIAQQEGVPGWMLAQIIGTESGYNPAAVSPKGAHGPAQLMPATARDLGVDINDPVDNIRGGARYLKQQLDTFGDPRLALAAYNAGPGAVQKAGGVPNYPETQAYVGKVMAANPSSDDIFGFSAGGAAKAPAGGSSDDIFAMKPTPVQTAPATAPKPAPTPLPPPQTGVGGQFATGTIEGAKPIADTLASFFGVPAILRSDAFANQVLHLMGRPSMPVAAAPQTPAQSIARTAGRMAVGAVAPGSIAQRVAAVAGPTAGSEAGGALFRNTPLEPAARFVGATLGGAAAGAAAGGVDSAIFNAKNPRTTPAQLRQQANALYTEIAHRDVKFTPDAVQSLKDGMDDVVGNLRGVYPNEANWIDTVNEALSKDPTVTTLDTLRSKMQQALTTPNGSRTPDQLRIGSDLVDEIDNFMKAAARNPQNMTTGMGDPQKVGELLTNARDLWRRMRNVQTVENLAESADIRNATAHIGGNAQNFTAQKLRTFVDPSTNKSLAGLSPDEQAQLQRVVMGTPATKALKLAGNLSPTKGIGALVNLTLGAMTGGKAPLILAPIGYAANKGGAALQQAQLESLLRLLATPESQKAALLAARPAISPAVQGAIMGGAATAPRPQRITK